MKFVWVSRVRRSASAECSLDSRLRGNERENGSQPRHQRSVDHVRYAIAADRSDGEVDIVEPEAVGGDELERKALRRQLRQSKLASLVAVAARAFHGDEFHREFLQR